MKLTEIEGEKALVVLADILEPASRIFTNPVVVAAISKENSTKIEWVKAILKETPREVIEIMAILDGVKPEEYRVNVLTLPVKLLEVFNDPEIESLFTSQGQAKTANASSGSV